MSDITGDNTNRDKEYRAEAMQRFEAEWAAEVELRSKELEAEIRAFKRMGFSSREITICHWPDGKSTVEVGAEWREGPMPEAGA